MAGWDKGYYKKEIENILFEAKKQDVKTSNELGFTNTFFQDKIIEQINIVLSRNQNNRKYNSPLFPKHTTLHLYERMYEKIINVVSDYRINLDI